jgi:hypothetical protein
VIQSGSRVAAVASGIPAEASVTTAELTAPRRPLRRPPAKLVSPLTLT